MEGDKEAVANKQPQQLIFENVSPATRLLEKRRQMYEVQDALETQKLRFAKDVEQFQKKEDQLRNKDLQLQHQLFRFNKFLQDNEAKRRRAETRAAEEAAQIQQKDDEVRELERQLEDSKKQCQELEEEVSRNMKHEEFLESVKDSCDDYLEIQDLVTRYETLEGANKDLMFIQSRSEDQIEEVRAEYQAYRKEQEMQVLAFSNRSNLLQSELEDVQRQRHFLENEADEATMEGSRHSLRFGQLLMSIENLFLRCTMKRKQIKHVSTFQDLEDGNANEEEDGDEDSFKKKHKQAIFNLRVILAYLVDFRSIVDTLKAERRKDNTRNVRPVMEQPKIPEPTFVAQEVEAGKGGHGSHASGSNGNTRELSKTTREVSGGSPAEPPAAE